MVRQAHHERLNLMAVERGPGSAVILTAISVGRMITLLRGVNACLKN